MHEAKNWAFYIEIDELNMMKKPLWDNLRGKRQKKCVTYANNMEIIFFILVAVLQIFLHVFMVLRALNPLR